MKAYLTEEGIPAFEIGSVIGRQGEMYITAK
jgi:hypothetical protein